MKPSRRHHALSALLVHAGSLRAALSTMGLLALVLALRLVTDEMVVAALVAALGAMALSLIAAIVVHPTLRRRKALLLAHLALLAVACLAGLGRLGSLEGRFELTEGVPYDGTLIDGRAGPWYRDTLATLDFMHQGFEIDYAAGRRRGATRNTVVWRETDGRLRDAVIGDHRPLLLNGHRIYTSPNKGFAPVLTWQPEHGEPTLGSVHLPSFPAQELMQSREWALPDGRTVWVMLQFDETLIDPKGPASFRKPASHVLVVRVGDERMEVQPGQALKLPGGHLRYEGLRTWMGYRITRDPVLPWLLAASLLATAALAWHYARLPGRQRRPAPRAAVHNHPEPDRMAGAHDA